MKYCTLLKAGAGQDEAFAGCDAVDDDHRFGLTPDGTLRHMEGIHLPRDRTVAFGAARGDMADLYPSLTPCGHPEGVPGAA